MSLLMALLVTTPAFAGGNSRHMHSHHRNHQQMHQNNHQHMHGQHMNQNQVQAKLQAVGNSGVSGFVHLNQSSGKDGAHIVVNAFGLTPGKQYVSLYYDNHTCELEPYSSEDVIGGIYTANGGGVGATQGNADDPLSDINSVSVRQARDFKLLACANVHP